MVVLVKLNLPSASSSWYMSPSLGFSIGAIWPTPGPRPPAPPRRPPPASPDPPATMFGLAEEVEVSDSV